MDDFRRPPINRLRSQGPRSTNGTRSVARPAAPQPVVVPPPVTPSEPTQAPGGGSAADPSASLPLPQPLGPLATSSKKSPKKRRLLRGMLGAAGLLIVIIGAVILWYAIGLSPVNRSDTHKIMVAIKTGATPNSIASTLKDKGLIRDQTAFLWYARLTNAENLLQAGTYRLSPSESTPDIISHLKKGLVDTFNITFLPGATEAQNKKVLESAGYTDADIDAAFTAPYTTSPLFDSRPASSDLEGYIWGDTYRVGADDTVSQVLQTAFDEYNKVIQDSNLVAQFQAHGLSLYQGITLASIVQRESSGKNNDDAQIAQVFYKRLSLNMPLGSDVTYQYIADKLGVARDPNIDSPYNTRRYPGLPPGPISSPGIVALKAVAQPANTDYLYFLSGDDGVTYFANTLQEHEQNAANHCKVKCQLI